MKSIKRAFLMASTVLLIFSCKDDELKPILTFEDAGKGAYPRLVDGTESGEKFLNLFDVAGSSYSYAVEFVDEKRGANVAEYVITVSYDDNDASNGDLSANDVELFRFTSSDFSKNANNYVQSPQISISGDGLVSAISGLSNALVTAGDNFNVVSTIVMNDGRIFQASNSSATVTGAAFQGVNFAFTIPAGCPSDLTGTFDYTSSNIWCDGSSTSGTVDIVALGGGVYEFSDWAFGSYGVCYGGGTAGGDLNFKDVCAVVQFTGFTDSFGDTWTYNSSITGDDWTIDWVNTYGEAAVSVITIPSIPFTLL